MHAVWISEVTYSSIFVMELPSFRHHEKRLDSIKIMITMTAIIII